MSDPIVYDDAEVNAYLNSRAEKDGRTNLPRFNPSKIRLIGRHPNKPNPDKEGRFYVKSFDETTKKYLDEVPFGAEPNTTFTGVILDVSYYAQWKYVEGSTTKLRTREFHDWRLESVELLRITFGEEKSKTETVRTFPNYPAFKESFCGIDSLTGLQKKSPYDLIACIYLYHPATKSTLKYEVKGMTRSALFDYDKAWRKAMPWCRTLVQILTQFGVERATSRDGEDFGWAGTFMAYGPVEPAMMREVMEADKALKAWQDAWKIHHQTAEKDEVDEEMSTIQIQDQNMMEAIDSIPF